MSERHVHYQIQVLHRGTKMHFPYVLFKTFHAFKISKDRLMSVCLLKCLNLQRVIFGTRKSSFLSGQRHLTTWSTSLQVSTVCSILCKQANLFDENVSEQWAIVFHFNDRAFC